MSRRAASLWPLVLLVALFLVCVMLSWHISWLESGGDRDGGLRSRVNNVLLPSRIGAGGSSNSLSAQMLMWEARFLNNTYFHILDGKARQQAEAEQPRPEHAHQEEETWSQELTCPHGELVQYWRSRPLPSDVSYRSPFGPGPEPKYVTFEPDVGGWNNIRMQMEAVLVFAASTGRTLVLPPDQPMYLLNKGKGHHNHHSFADFFPFDLIRRIVPVVSMADFLKTEALQGRLLSKVTGQPLYPPGNEADFSGTVTSERNAMWEYLRNASSCPPWKCMREYLVIPRVPGFNSSLAADAQDYARRELVFAGDPKFGMKRSAQRYDAFWQGTRAIHFISKPGGGFRLLQHFYTFLHMEDPAMDRYYKRFVRDYVHYLPDIFCKAALIVASLLEEGAGSYSSWHVRRGEFQYKETRLPAEDLLKNVGHFIPAGELLFIATDEQDKAFFEPFRKRFPRLRFLGDYMDKADLRSLNPNYLGMIDQIVCTRGRLFMGTWFSTFTGYITRMRGYMGLPDNSTRYTDKKHRDRFQKYEMPRFPFYMREFPLAWENID